MTSGSRARNTTEAGERDVVRAEGVEDCGAAYADEFREGLNADYHPRIFLSIFQRIMLLSLLSKNTQWIEQICF